MGPSTPERIMTADFRRLFLGQILSNFGSAFTAFSLPLLVYQLTGSAVHLALVTAFEFAPILLLGLIIGAWLDRADRRRVMIGVDWARSVVTASIPVLDLADALTIWWLYLVAFANGALWIAFSAGESAAVRNLVAPDRLLTANGRLQAGYQIAQVTGPVAATAVLGVGIPIAAIYAVDALTFVVSAVALTLIRRSFNEERIPARKPISREVFEGVRHTFENPLLRNVSLLAVLVNLFAVTVTTELVYFVKTRFAVHDASVGLLYAAGSLGIALMSLGAARLRGKLSFRAVTFGAIMLYGLSITGLAVAPSFWFTVAVWFLAAGLPYLYAIQTTSLRQTIVPDHLLGRVITAAQVMAWSVNPLGALLGGWIIAASGNISLVFGVLGVLIFLSACAFWFSVLTTHDLGTDRSTAGPEPPESGAGKSPKVRR